MKNTSRCDFKLLVKLFCTKNDKYFFDWNCFHKLITKYSNFDQPCLREKYSNSHSFLIYRKEVSRTHRKKFNEGFNCKDRSEKVVSVG